MTRHAPDLRAQRIVGGVHTARHHDSAHKHVAGTAVYIDDIVEPAGTLHAGLGLSGVAHGVLKSVDLSAVRSAPGVVAVLTYQDVPGENDISPSNMHDDPVFAETTVEFHGQPIFCVVAETRDQLPDRRLPDAADGAVPEPVGDALRLARDGELDHVGLELRLALVGRPAPPGDDAVALGGPQAGGDLERRVAMAALEPLGQPRVAAVGGREDHP